MKRLDWLNCGIVDATKQFCFPPQFALKSVFCLKTKEACRDLYRNQNMTILMNITGLELPDNSNHSAAPTLGFGGENNGDQLYKMLTFGLGGALIAVLLCNLFLG